MALATGVLAYAVLLRLGVQGWLAALATAPLLLDAFQLSVEQHIVSDPFSVLLVVAASAVLLWRAPVAPSQAALAGVLLAAASVVRAVGLILIVPGLVAAVLPRGRPRRAVTVLALVAGFLAPIGAYAVWAHASYGRYAITGEGTHLLYARVAVFADCTKFAVPRRERPLCPDLPVADRPSTDDLAWGNDSPWFRVPRRRRNAVGSDFIHRVILHQPGAYVTTVLGDLVNGFAWRRSVPRRLTPFLETWAFPASVSSRKRIDAVIRDHGGTRSQMDAGLSGFLRTYQKFAYTPGPLLAVTMLAGFGAALGLRRARSSPLRLPAFFLAALGLLLAAFPAATHFLSPRYMLAGLVLLPMAGALAVRALSARPAASPG
jgi:hypothetical protein